MTHNERETYTLREKHTYTERKTLRETDIHTEREATHTQAHRDMGTGRQTDTHKT